MKQLDVDVSQPAIIMTDLDIVCLCVCLRVTTLAAEWIDVQTQNLAWKSSGRTSRSTQEETR